MPDPRSIESPKTCDSGEQCYHLTIAWLLETAAGPALIPRPSCDIPANIGERGPPANARPLLCGQVKVEHRGGREPQ